MLRPIVCAVEAYERFSFERSVRAQPALGGWVRELVD